MALLLAAAVVAGCSSGPMRPAPVEDRSHRTSRGVSSTATGTAGGAAASPDAPPRVLPGAENAGKPGYYSVRPGDTVMRVALEHGQAWRDIVRWNALDNANLIEVGQVLRVVPPGAEPGAVRTAGTGGGGVEARPVETRPIETRPVDAPMRPAAASAPGASPAAAATPSPTAAAIADDAITWGWPSSGPVLAPFEEGRSKGLTFGGKAGDPVVAAADGQVVYAGGGLRGYGNLIIVKHSANFLTAYAHNQTLLVKDEQPVRRGQKIAEMGSTDADRVQLHFEVRRQGRPQDPARVLPPR